jgi:hypothetical protein
MLTLAVARIAPQPGGEASMRVLRKRTLSWVPFVTALAVSLVFGASAAAALELGDKAPEFTLPGTTGENISLSQFRGKKAVLIEFYVGESPT